MIKTNNFARRQTPTAPFSHFDGTWEELEALVEQHWENRQASLNNPDVFLVPVPPAGFYSAIVDVTPSTILTAALGKRREGEDPFIQVNAHAPKQKAQYVEIVVYAKKALGDDASTDADYEIVSINARITHEEEPLTPQTMARNFLERPGGTKTTYTAEEFARAIHYWSTKVPTQPE